MTSPIWTTPKTLEELNEFSKNTLHEHLGIEFIDMGDNYLKAKMPVDARTLQPHGILHGGASVVLAETTGSIASEMCVDHDKRCIGLDINANHIRKVSSGYVYCTARPAHMGQTTQVWLLDITNEQGKMICHSRLTMMIQPQ
ncbi:hotdog fold thioesterase [Endozoicomonas sp. SM1973]|uniref:Hotdog fold thioesterase n=1 Tax=Spartinivicinus marinus TaxID=2994442 RepID=A0A853I9W1_9GAMM|nr:hotdog fold thioesterase [Spartinivicinus marinus]NYZ70063.1 hotdog fold thioesterase [Spartinivicinus marinus]